MGTNFYWSEARHADDDHLTQHIGKRSAAGLYCYDCGSTLNRGGTDVVHQSSAFNLWQDACPNCEKTKETQPLTASSAGVSMCCSFSWTLMKHKWEIEELARTYPDEQVIVDEYGDTLSASEFIEMLAICPIEFQTPSSFS